jgi:glucosamine--fructose-6-phosphate aminotransferase (isomerizing)
MQKEIFEQPDSVLNTMRGRVNFKEKSVVLGGFKENIKEIRRCRRLMFIACGTSYNSALATRAFLEEMTEMPISIDIASDFMDRQVPIFRDDCCFFVSQSGETADTLSALRYCKSKGAMIVGITNTVGSSLSRESHCGVHINAGPEIGVASTKAYSSQILAILMFGLMMADDKTSMRPRCEEIISALEDLSDNISKVLEQDDLIKKLADDLADEKSLLVMGRGTQYANCVEGALKIKELTYLHSEGILAGELKHGPLAMIDENLAVIMIMMKDHTWSRSQNALQQVVARKGRPIVLCNPGVDVGEGLPDEVRKALRVLEVPKTDPYVQAIVSVIPLQLLSYHIAVKKGFDVDCPRNLAKSVTVE